MTDISDIKVLYRKFVLTHEIKKEYLTVLLPLAIAVIIIASSLIIANQLESSQSGALQGDVYEEYLKSIGRVTGESKATAEEIQRSWVADHLDHILIFAVLVAIMPYGIDSFLERKRRRRYEEEYSEFLFEVSELLRSGIDPIKALIEISRSEFNLDGRDLIKVPKAHLKALTPLVQKAASLVAIGKSFEYAMERMAEDTGSDLVRKYAHLVVMATYIGGDVSGIILRASSDMKTYLRIQKEKESDLRQYVVILYFAHAILIAMIFMLITYLLPYIETVDLGGAGGILFGQSNAIQLGGGLQDLGLERYFFHLIVINASVIGLIIGKIVHGHVKHGLIHSSILIIVSYLLSLMLILPGGGGGVDLTVLSGDGQMGKPLAQLDEPLVFQVLEHGLPYRDHVTISVKGPGGVRGSARPNRIKPDDEGMISTTITLGQKPGLYTITVKAGRSEGLATATAIDYRV
ncbi:MAG: type II secretion system F domain-containing protein [Candidatus Syntrophoarchaeum butanivorans]|uniref:Type II secretion system F domain-containing protein n=1 Tax=Candidatus Syntropharchaeum butanivorans TaxID=1839936 RepID=A0A1F2P2R3_9EURY|nr:MAG: type II secretion system F domain-containing protein [Candidatus Syntrophoarchaeum butanivorans]